MSHTAAERPPVFNNGTFVWSMCVCVWACDPSTCATHYHVSDFSLEFRPVMPGYRSAITNRRLLASTLRQTAVTNVFQGGRGAPTPPPAPPLPPILTLPPTHPSRLSQPVTVSGQRIRRGHGHCDGLRSGSFALLSENSSSVSPHLISPASLFIARSHIMCHHFGSSRGLCADSAVRS